jgi:hypothetical protein
MQGVVTADMHIHMRSLFYPLVMLQDDKSKPKQMMNHGKTKSAEDTHQVPSQDA